MSKKPEPEQFIVKMQLPLFSTEGQPILIYNEDRTIMHQQEATPELVALFHGEPKIYMVACITEDSQLGLIDYADDQEW